MGVPRAAHSWHGYKQGEAVGDACMTCSSDCAQIIRREQRASECVCTLEMTGGQASMRVQATCVDRGAKS